MARFPNPYIDVESELSKAIAVIGGARVDQLKGASSSKNADFFFGRYNVVAELKSLEKDQINDKKFIKKASDIYAKYLKEGRSPIVVFGTRNLTTEGFPEDFRLEIANLYSVPIGRVIRNADRQIEATKSLLRKPNSKGLLLLVNDGNSALDPSHMRWIIGEHLGEGKYPNINHVIYFTANMPVRIPGRDEIIAGVPGDMDLNVWYSAGRQHLPAIDRRLEPDLRTAWFSHLSKIVGRVAEVEPDATILDVMTNVSER